MSISSIGMSYSALRQFSASSLSVKGQETSDSEKASKPSTNSMDKVSLSSDSSSYTIGGDSVSKAEFDKYDTNGDGKISGSEKAAYEANKTKGTGTDNTQSELLDSLQKSQDETDNSESGYSSYGGISLGGETGSLINATA